MSIVAAVVSSTGGTLTLGDSPSGGLRVEITVPGAQTSVPSR
jgi:signal transduction histidine kinase